MAIFRCRLASLHTHYFLKALHNLTCYSAAEVTIKPYRIQKGIGKVIQRIVNPVLAKSHTCSDRPSLDKYCKKG